MPKTVLKKLCNFCTAEVFKSFSLGTWTYAYVTWRAFICSGFPVLGLRFQLLTKESQRSQGFVIGMRSVIWLIPVEVVYTSRCWYFSSASCMCFMVCLQVRAARRVSNSPVGQVGRSCASVWYPNVLVQFVYLVALFSNLAGWMHFPFFPEACCVLWSIGLSGRNEGIRSHPEFSLVMDFGQEM